MQTRTAPAIVLATSLGLSLATPATSEPIRKRDDPAALLAQVRPGAKVRVEDTKGRFWEGRYVTTTDGAVVLEGPLARIPSASVRQVWIRGRATISGAITGGVLLGLVKAVRAGFGAGFQCEHCEGVVRATGTRGFGIGAGIGALIGGLVGAAIPKWHRPDLDRPTPTRTGGGLGARLGLATRLPDEIAPGVELGRFGVSPGTAVTPRGRALDFTDSVTHFDLSLTKAGDHGFNAFTLDPDFEIIDPGIQRRRAGAAPDQGVAHGGRELLW